MRPASLLLLLPALMAATFNPSAPAQSRVPNAGCPVRVSLRPNLSGGRVMRSSSDEPEHTVNVTVGGAGDRAVTAVEVTVHGLQKSNGFLPNNRGPKEVAVTFHLVQPADADGPLTAELKLPSSMASVGSATVEAVTYRDGETWKAGAEAACMVIPQKLIPVASLR
jgi:hypothetical protein